MSVIDAGRTRSLTKTWMTLLESFPSRIADADPIWIFVLGLLAFRPLLVLGICFELRFGSLLGCLFLRFRLKEPFLGTSCLQAVGVQTSVNTLITCHHNHLEGFDAFSFSPSTECGGRFLA